MKLTFLLAGATLALCACNLEQNLGGGGGSTTSTTSTKSTTSTTSSSQPASCTDGIKDGTETDVDCGGGTCATCAVGKLCKVDADCVSHACDAFTLVCVATQCSDHLQDGTETDVDCGGGTCPPCATGKQCKVSADCTSGDCVAHVCQSGTAATCTDGIQDGVETDVDCGGATCPACSVGKKCKIDADCTSNACDAVSLVCVAAQCADHLKDGTETDVDCGGGTCAPCAAGKQCKVGSDCTSNDCVANICQSGSGATCTDSIQDGVETDVDCGGGTCPACSVGKKCKVDADCTSHACDANALICVATQCTDHLKDGAETDVDCGGSTCAPCATGKQCQVNSDCTSDDCVANVCHSGTAGTCTDGFMDGTETDVDCGGGTCPTCSLGKKCVIDADCVSNACDAITLICVANQCADHLKDGNETDVDCGGGTCATCAVGKQCKVNADCTTNHCSANVCQ